MNQNTDRTTAEGEDQVNHRGTEAEEVRTRSRSGVNHEDTKGTKGEEQDNHRGTEAEEVRTRSRSGVNHEGTKGEEITAKVAKGEEQGVTKEELARRIAEEQDRKLSPLRRAGRLVELAFEGACDTHPCWPDDIVHGAAIVGEEAGELLQAAIDATYHHDHLPTVAEELVKKARVEAAQCAAVCLRFLIATEDTSDAGDHAIEREDLLFGYSFTEAIMPGYLTLR